MIRIGLTGGMGCGKTAASRFFAEEGFGSLDADQIVHELLAEDLLVIGSVSEKFGESMLKGGEIDRGRLGKLVFSDRDALRWLENLLHPLVEARWRAEIDRGADRPWVVQIPLLFEKRLEQFFDFTVCVGASAETQRLRLLQRGLSQEEIDRRTSLQMPLEEKSAKADFFILNDGSLEFLQEQVRHLCGQLTQVCSGRLSDTP